MTFAKTTRLCLCHVSIVSALLLYAAGAAAQELMGRERPPELMAVLGGMKTLAPYVQGGGRFTGQKNHDGQTAAMFAASSSAEVIEYFYKAGGRFTREKDKSGRTAAFYAVDNRVYGSENSKERPAAIAAFVKFGGRFTDEQDLQGDTVASVVVRSPEDIPAFLRAGGRLDADSTTTSYNVGMRAVQYGAESIEAFSRAGGKFNSHQVYDQSAGEMAAKSGGEVWEAYNKAIVRQGGLVYVSTDDEFSALRTPLRVESFIKAGGHFDDRTDKNGWTTAMNAMWAGGKVAQAFSAYGGRFTTQRDSRGETAEHFIRDAATKTTFIEAVQRQGGLITVMPADQYEAARIGAAAIVMFAKAGGRFTETPDRNDMTSAMIAAVSGSDAIHAFVRAGGRFSDWQNDKGYTAAIVAVISGPEAIRAFTVAGGRFTKQEDHHGRTAALWSIARQDIGWPSARMELHFPEHTHRGGLVNPGDGAISTFLAGGGNFDDHQDSSGQTAAMLAIENGREAIMAFAAAGGHFTEQEDKSGRTAEEWAVFRTADRIRAFAAAGGRFTGYISSKGTSSEMTVSFAGDPDMITAYSEAGGLFTDRKYAEDWTSEILSSNKFEWFVQQAVKLSGVPATQQFRAFWKEKLEQRDIETAKAYRAAIVRQGGIRHVPER